MIITWDNAKRLANLDKQGWILPSWIVDVHFCYLTCLISRRARRVSRPSASIRSVAIIVVIFAPLGTEAVSVVSMRPASAKEKELLHDR